MAALARKVEALLAKLNKPVVAAVMGCVVNGPGEAKHADIGIAGGGDGKAALFAKGEADRHREPKPRFSNGLKGIS